MDIKPFEPNIKKKEVPKISPWWNLEKTVYIDTETSNGKGAGSLNANDPESFIALVQTKIGDEVKVQKWTPEAEAWIRQLNDEGYTFVFHNAPFDLYWLKVKAGISIDNVFDTQIASQILNAGRTQIDYATIASRKTEVNKSEILDIVENIFEESDDDDDLETTTKKASFFSHSLAATAIRYAGVKMVKDLANSDWSRDDLTEDQLRYASEDVMHLDKIVKNQLYFAEKLGCLKVMELEMRLIPAIVDMRYNGILLDKVEWEKVIEEYAAEAAALEEELNESMGMELAEKEDLGDSLFGILPKKFSVSSPAQLLNFFKDELIDGKPITSAGEAVLKNIRHPSIKKILQFKTADKLSTTYGTGYLKHIQVDGRIHAELKQVSNAAGKAIATGRFASSEPNLQNIPPDILKGMTRAKEGYKKLTADYSSVEAKILAYASGDPGYIESVNSTDIHRVNASKMFKIPIAQITADMRSKAKVLSFAVPYGASAMGMWQKGLGDTLEEAEKLLNDFYTSFPLVKRYLDEKVVEAMTTGKTQDYFGRIRWYEQPSPGSVDDKELSSIQKGIKRQAQNHTIQSLSASVTKKAILDLYHMLKEKGWGYMILTVHDSVFFEIKEEHLAKAIPEIKRIMEAAGPYILPGLVSPVEFDIGDKIYKTDKISGIKFPVYEMVWDEENGLQPNPVVLSEDTEKNLKVLNIPVSDDYQGMYAQVIEKLEVMSPDWLEKNEKWVSAVRNLQ